MRRNLLTVTVLFALAGGVAADEKAEKYAKPGTQSGPPPGKGWRKNETPVPPAPMAIPAPKKSPMAVKPPAPVPQKKEDGIGPQVSAWARSGIHGRQLAAMIHQLQAVRAKQAPVAPQPTVKPGKGKPEVTPPAPITPKKKPKNEKSK